MLRDWSQFHSFFSNLIKDSSEPHHPLFHPKLKADQPHPRDYPHTPTNYRHTDKHLRLVMTPIALYCTRQSRAPNIDRCAPEVDLDL